MTKHLKVRFTQVQYCSCTIVASCERTVVIYFTLFLLFYMIYYSHGKHANKTPTVFFLSPGEKRTYFLFECTRKGLQIYLRYSCEDAKGSRTFHISA